MVTYNLSSTKETTFSSLLSRESCDVTLCVLEEGAQVVPVKLCLHR